MLWRRWVFVDHLVVVVAAAAFHQASKKQRAQNSTTQNSTNSKSNTKTPLTSLLESLTGEPQVKTRLFLCDGGSRFLSK